MSSSTDGLIAGLKVHSLMRSDGWLESNVGKTELYEYSVRDAIEWMNEYSRRTEREACGMVCEVDGQQIWRGMANAADRDKARHEFKLDEDMVRAVVISVRNAGGIVVAIVHSHPFVSMGSRGWVGPSTRDTVQLQHAEAMEEADIDVHIPEMVIWSPKAGTAGILSGYNSRGTTWSWLYGVETP